MVKRHALTIPLLLALTGCGGGGSGGDTPRPAPPEDGDAALPIKRIEGTVNNALTGAPIAGATVQTTPATESVTTDADGAYVIDDAVNDAGRYQVTATRLGFRAEQRTVSVAASDVSTADFRLDPIVNGLAANFSSVRFEPGRDALSIILTSTAADTSFTIDTGEPWLSAVPASGTIAENENRLIRIEADREGLAGTRVATTLVINAGNGLPGVVLDVTVDLVPQAGTPSTPDSPPSPDAGTGGGGDGLSPVPTVDDPIRLGADQGECKREDILRSGFGDTDGPSVVFPTTIALPGGERQYHRGSIPFNVHVESLHIRRAGRVSLSHVLGGPTDTHAVLFDIDRNGTVREYASQDPARPGRAAISAFLEPGLYCYVLQPRGGFFGFELLGDQTVDVVVEFEPAAP